MVFGGARGGESQLFAALVADFKSGGVGGDGRPCCGNKLEVG
jgi:hypothetical protein